MPICACIKNINTNILEFKTNEIKIVVLNSIEWRIFFIKKCSMGTQWPECQMKKHNIVFNCTYLSSKKMTQV